MSNNSIYKRLIREIKDIHREYLKCSLQLDNDKYIIILTIQNKKVNYEKKQIKFIFNESYPFKCPSLYINDRNYLNMLCSSYMYINLYSKNQEKCMCKNSSLCHGNWSPAIRLMDLIDEYIKNYNIMLKAIQKRYLKIILKEKNIIGNEYYEMIEKYI
jgi:ubiquitin-protein ligase